MFKAVFVTVFVILLSVSGYAKSAGPNPGNPSVSTTIRVRIPSFAIINLAENISRQIPAAPLSSTRQQAAKELNARDVLSNQLWNVHVVTEQSTLNAYNSKKNETSRVNSTSVIYTTTLD